MSFFGKILLASGSPRRFTLLTEAGFEVEKLTSREVDETYPTDLPHEEIPVYLSRLKALVYDDVCQQHGLPLVAADTLVLLDGEPIGKPHGMDEAKEMLGHLSGNTHTVITGVTLLRPDGREVSFSEYTDVTFGKLSSREIHYYIENYRPLDKAGSYGIQEWIGLIGVEKIDGDFYNIMGFPVHRFLQIFNSDV